jgi:hypothetical protein
MSTENTRAAALEAIAKVVTQFEHAQQNELPEEFIALTHVRDYLDAGALRNSAGAI